MSSISEFAASAMAGSPQHGSNALQAAGECSASFITECAAVLDKPALYVQRFSNCVLGAGLDKMHCERVGIVLQT